MGVLAVLPAWEVPTRCAVLLAWRRLRCATLTFFPNESVHVIDVIDGILQDQRVLLSFERPSFAAILLNVRQ